jgi:hypothetical protein
MDGRMDSAYRYFKLTADIAKTHQLIAVQATSSGGSPRSKRWINSSRPFGVRRAF